MTPRVHQPGHDGQMALASVKAPNPNPLRKTIERACARRCSMWRRFLLNVSGATAVEAAFVLPILIMGSVFITELGRILYSKAELEYAVYHASRFSMIVKTADETAFQTKLGDTFIMLNPAAIQAVNMSEVVNADSTRTTTITTAYRFEFMLPFVSPDPINLSNSVTFLRGAQ